MKRQCALRFLAWPFIVLSAVSIVLAQQQFSANNGFAWLVAHGQDGNYGSDIPTTAFAVMALKASGQPDHAEAGLAYIRSQEDAAKHCWPKDGCKTKDTAFALWVLDSYGEDTADGEAWLQKSITAALRDNWFLEVITTNNGTCRISYTKSDATTQTQRDVAVSQGKFPSCRGNFPSTFFELNTCLENNLLASNPGVSLDVNCNELGPSTIISVIYNSGNKYYLIKEAATSRDVVAIENGCFGEAAKSSCSSDSSLFANWALREIDSDVRVSLWLKNNYDSLRVADNALLFLASDEQARQHYLRQLKSLQRNDGSFNNQVFDTAAAVLALKDAQSTTELDAAVNWLKSKQAADGSWENNLYKSAFVLYSAFGSASVALPPIGPGGPELGFCGDGTCDPDENSNDCPIDCPATREGPCVENGVCDVSFGENSQNCGQDCSCGDGMCDSSEDEQSCSRDCRGSAEQECGNNVVEGTEECDGSEDAFCPGRCGAPGTSNACGCQAEEGGGFPWWIPIVLVLAVVIAIVLYVKMKKPPTRGSATTRPDFGFMPKPPVQPPARKIPQSTVRSKVEDELEKSINEAKKLFKKL